MSRRSFREAVGSPRPRSATAMALIATGTLALTGQVHPAVLVVGIGAIGFAAFRRGTPFGWQRSALALNGALIASLGVAMALWLQGQLAMIALAHFAVLAQGLQLLDARPRRSEFLLVALALFQVILAANMTESLLYPVALAAFTVAAVWTLLVHTLRAEALEAGEPAAVARAVSGGLRRTITLASLASVVTALVLFPMLPRVRAGALLSGGGGPGMSVSGFSDRVELGDIGRIRMDPRVVLRVQTIEGEAPAPERRYLRGLAFDHFDGQRWSITPPSRHRVPGDPERGVRVSPDPPARRNGPRLVQRIAREEMQTPILFAPGRLLSVRGVLGHLELDAGGSLHARRTRDARVDYQVTSRLVEPPLEDLRRDRAVEPPSDRAAALRGRTLRLPPLSPELARIAHAAVAGAGTDADRARALERWLRTNGRYTDTPPKMTDEGGSPIETFLLGDLAGHCEYFATGMAVMARSLGLPARIVSGFAGGRQNPLGSFVEYAQSDAHTWVEIHYDDAGWVPYDPTPVDLRLAGADALRETGSAAALFSAVEHWWFRNVVDYDRGSQLRALRGVWLQWRDWRKARSDSPGPTPGAGDALGPWAPTELPRGTLVGLVAIGVLSAVLLARRRRARAPTEPPDYARALRLLAGKGLAREPATTARAFAREVEAQIPRAARAFHALTEAHLAVRFGGADAPETAEALLAVRRALQARTS